MLERRDEAVEAPNRGEPELHARRSPRVCRRVPHAFRGSACTFAGPETAWLIASDAQSAGLTQLTSTVVVSSIALRMQ